MDASVDVGGDIWSTGAFSFESPLKDLLDQGDYTLEELLAQDELLQELRAVHPLLIQFFSTEESVAGLINYIIASNDTSATKAAVVARTRNGGSSLPSLSQPVTDHSEEGVEVISEQQTTRSKLDEDDEEYKAIRYPYMACEVICCEITNILDILVDGHVPSSYDDNVPGNSDKTMAEERNEEVEFTNTKNHLSILDLLFSMLDDDNEVLDDYRAGYLEKILSLLMRLHPVKISTYLNEKGGVPLLKKLIKHLYSHSIMQIIQRLLLPVRYDASSAMQEEEEDEGGEEMDDDDDDRKSNGESQPLFLCNWSEFPEAFELLRDSLLLLDIPVEEQTDLQLATSQNASEVLMAVIQNSPLTSGALIKLTTDPVLPRIIEATYTLPEGADFSPHDSSLTCAVNVLESLVLQLGGYGSIGVSGTHDDDDDEEEDDGSLDLGDGMESLKPSRPDVANAETLTRYLPTLLTQLCNLLCHVSTKTWRSPMQFSQEQALLGMSRLKIVRLVESLVLLGDTNVDKCLCESDCLKICLDLFWEFQWCSMLHQSVANLLVHVFEGADERAGLQEYFLVKCNLLQRLMDSFDDDDDDDHDNDDVVSDAVMAIQELHRRNRALSVESTRGSFLDDSMRTVEDENEIIPVSDDDVDAALEHSDVVTDLEEEKAPDTIQVEGDNTHVALTEEAIKKSSEVKSSIPSLRMGCLGHVIIICQALVHASSKDVHGEHEQQGQDEADASEVSAMMRSVDLGECSPVEDGRKEMAQEESSTDHSKAFFSDRTEAATDTQEGQGEEAVAETLPSNSMESPMNDLVIAQLLQSHPLYERWTEFVATTLAAETAIQSTPLGGTNTVAVTPMQSQVVNLTHSSRTYNFGDDDVEDPQGGSAKGFLGSEVLDMDDNELDIAASMMEALSLSSRSKHGRGDRGTDAAGEPSKLRRDTTVALFTTAIPAGTTSGDYVFDDPLGGSSKFGIFCHDDDSDEEVHPGENDTGDGYGGPPTRPGPDDDDDAPVMDLFTGNFHLPVPPSQSLEGSSAQANGQNGTWTNFANFDDAFAAASTNDTTIFGSSSSDEEDVVLSTSPPAPGVKSVQAEKNFDDIFGGGSTHHDLLLADEDVLVSSQEVEPADEDINESAPGDPHAGDDTTNVSEVQEMLGPSMTELVEENSEKVGLELDGNEPKLESNMSG